MSRLANRWQCVKNVLTNRYIIPYGDKMKILKIDMQRPPENTKISIVGKDCKCIKYSDKTYINVKDITDKNRDDIDYIIHKNQDLTKYLIELCMYGQCDYYVDGTIGLTQLIEKINNDKFWY